MLQRTAVTLLVLGVAPLTAQQDYMARARPMLGCWSIAVGAYAPKLTERGRDTAAVYPPRVMKVDTTAGQGLEATDGLGWLIAGVTPPIEQRWRGAVMLGRVDSVEINWFRTSGVLTAVVKPARDTVRGRLIHMPFGGDAYPSAPITMIRTRCP
ncbi:MAG: hypothetical protein IPJ11_14065 [Gemmatimonadetes bacterium]|nr:hypothetical protein [Gemmatimonadota bacterium]